MPRRADPFDVLDGKVSGPSGPAVRAVPNSWEQVTDLPPDVSSVLNALCNATNRPCVNGLRELLQRAAQAIFDAEREAGVMPKRKVLRSKLEQIRATSRKLAQLVQHSSVINAAPELLSAFGGPTISEGAPSEIVIRNAFGAPDGVDVPMALARLEKLAKDRLRGIPKGRGRPTVAPAYGRFGGLLLCALVIAEAFRRIYRRLPSPKHMPAQEACAALWRASGQGVSKGVATGEVAIGTAWQRHLGEACAILAERDSSRASTRNSILVTTVSEIFGRTK